MAFNFRVLKTYGGRVFGVLTFERVGTFNIEIERDCWVFVEKQLYFNF